MKKIQFTDNVKTTETPKSSKKYKVTQDYHPNKLNIMNEEKKENNPMKTNIMINNKENAPKQAVFGMNISFGLYFYVFSPSRLSETSSYSQTSPTFSTKRGRYLLFHFVYSTYFRIRFKYDFRIYFFQYDA